MEEIQSVDVPVFPLCGHVCTGTQNESWETPAYKLLVLCSIYKQPFGFKIKKKKRTNAPTEKAKGQIKTGIK